MVFSAGPRYWAHSFDVSGAVTFSTAPMAEQMKETGLEKLFKPNTPLMPPSRGSKKLTVLASAVGAT